MDSVESLSKSGGTVVSRRLASDSLLEVLEGLEPRHAPLPGDPDRGAGRLVREGGGPGGTEP